VRRAAALAAEGINLTGIRRILALEAQVSALRAELARTHGASRFSEAATADSGAG
jgi:hypothetical protein